MISTGNSEDLVFSLYCAQEMPNMKQALHLVVMDESMYRSGFHAGFLFGLFLGHTHLCSGITPDPAFRNYF